MLLSITILLSISVEGKAAKGSETDSFHRKGLLRSYYSCSSVLPMLLQMYPGHIIINNLVLLFSTFLQQFRSVFTPSVTYASTFRIRKQLASFQVFNYCSIHIMYTDNLNFSIKLKVGISFIKPVIKYLTITCPKFPHRITTLYSYNA